MHMLSKLFKITPTPTVYSGGSLFYQIVQRDNNHEVQSGSIGIGAIRASLKNLDTPSLFSFSLIHSEGSIERC